MHCSICYISCFDEPLFRNNPIGEDKADWRCQRHLDRVVNQDELELANLIVKEGKPTMKNHPPPSGYDTMTPEEYERFSLFIEEVGETLQVIGKIQRHGYHASFEGIEYNNRGDLETKLGHLLFVISLMVSEGDICPEAIGKSQKLKSEMVWRYLHYNKDPFNEADPTDKN